MRRICGKNRGRGIVNPNTHLGGYQYILSLNGGTWADKVQSAQVFLECDESGSKVIERRGGLLETERFIYTI